MCRKPRRLKAVVLSSIELVAQVSPRAFTDVSPCNSLSQIWRSSENHLGKVSTQLSCLSYTCICSCSALSTFCAVAEHRVLPVAKCGELWPTLLSDQKRTSHLYVPHSHALRFLYISKPHCCLSPFNSGRLNAFLMESILFQHPMKPNLA